MSLIRFLLRASRGTVLSAIAAGALSGASGFALLALVHEALSGRPGPARVLGGVFAALCVVEALARTGAQVAMTRLGQETIAGLGLRVCRDLLALPLEEFERLDGAELLAVLTEDIPTVAGAVVGLPLVGINLPVVVLGLAYIGWLAPRALACAVAFAAVGIAVFLALSSRAMQRLEQARAERSRLVEHIRSLLGGFRELKQNARRRAAFVAEALVPATSAARDEATAGLALFATADGWSQVCFFGFLGVLLFVLPGVPSFNRATLVGTTLVVLYLMTPLDVLLTWLPILGRARVALGQILAVLPDLEARPTDTRGTGQDLVLREEIRLEGVRYAYPAEADGFALGPIDLTFTPGEVVFVVGGNGSGKTTLVKVLAGLYPAQAGTIRLDDRPIPPDCLEAYRQLVSVVFADGYLFQALLGLERSDLAARVGDGLARLGLERSVRLDGHAYSTVDLSMGQRRRLALLTACLEDRPILILDEWAANQDHHFKEIFYRELLPEWRARGKAVVVISHDEEFYDQADRVLVLREGRLVSDAWLAQPLSRIQEDAG